jgi:hypothetical protein
MEVSVRSVTIFRLLDCLKTNLDYERSTVAEFICVHLCDCSFDTGARTRVPQRRANNKVAQKSAAPRKFQLWRAFTHQKRFALRPASPVPAARIGIRANPRLRRPSLYV